MYKASFTNNYFWFFRQ